MLQLSIAIGRALALGLRGHRELVLENLAPRQQLLAMQRTTMQPLSFARIRSPAPVDSVADRGTG